MDLIKTAFLLVQFGTAPSFPEGEASQQLRLADKIEVICIDNGLKYSYHTLKKNPSLRKYKPSLFTKSNIQGMYFFLTHIDSTYLYIEDCDYSLLKFLRLKTKNQSLEYIVIDSVDNISLGEKLRVIRWKNPVNIMMFEDGLVFETSFTDYSEYWRCGDKNNYAPKYPFVKPLPSLLRKNYTEEEQSDLKYILSNPIMVFSAIALDENKIELPFNLEGRSYKASFEALSGEELEGWAIDLNSDKIPDAFWYHDIISTKIVEVFTRLYLNIEGQFIPVWYTYFKEK
ncbi:MAG: hypothetical protein N2510_08605 [Ignavibacteria bacterium]|nr:hypothetical protein [Ignavibacteria bacterium]